MPAPVDLPSSPGGDDFSSLFDFLPIGAYRTLPDGTMLRANPALVRLNGYASEAELLVGVRDIALEWYVDPGRREVFSRQLEADGQVRAFVSEIYRYKTRERIWISENAHLLRDADGRVRYYEGTVEDITERVTAQAALAHSEQQFRLIASQMPGMAYRIHVRADGTRAYSFVSEGVRELYGVAPEAVLADPLALHRFWHPDDRERLQAESTLAMLAGGPLLLEFRVVLDDGRLKWLQLISSAIPTDDGGAVRTGVQIDITAHKQAEARLRENEQRWKLALESAGDGVWDWDLRSGREVVSARLLQIYGIGEADHDGRPELLDARTHPDDVAQMRRDRDAHLYGDAPAYVNEHRMRASDGRWIWVLTRGMVIERGPGGEPLRMIGTHTDISERKEAESLRRERDRTAASQKAQNAFLSRVSHELRTPLNAIIGFAQLLDLERVGTPRQLVWVRTIVDSGRHLLALVNDLLDLSSAQTGQLQFTSSAVDVAVLLRDVWTLHAADAAAAGVSLLDKLPANGECRVQCDPTRLRQVLSNLLSNAIKYNRAGGLVAVAAARSGDSVELSVRDSGQGMDEAQLERLFNPFERLGAQHSSVSGTGLGLALAKQLVEAMGGDIRVLSTPGQGSTFFVRLSAART